MKLKAGWIVLISSGVLLLACGIFWGTPGVIRQTIPLLDGPADAKNGGRIYFRASSARGTAITYRGGTNFGGMMMGGNLTCAACHGPNARGGLHTMHMQVMDAPDITYDGLRGEAGEHDEPDDHDDEHGDAHSEYDLEDFRQAVIEGKHPDGEPLSRDMPRWRMSDEDLADLLEFLKEIQ